MSLIIRPDNSGRFIPFNLLRKQTTVNGNLVDGLAYWTLPTTMYADASYINASLLPVDNWITTFFKKLTLTKVSEEERVQFLEEEAADPNGYNWEYDVLQVIDPTITEWFGKGAPMYKSQQNFTYTYNFPSVPVRVIQRETSAVEPETPPDEDLWLVNKETIMQHLQMAYDGRGPSKVKIAVYAPRTLFSVQLGEQTHLGIDFRIQATMVRAPIVYRIDPFDPGLVKVPNLTLQVTNNNNVVLSELATVHVGHDDVMPDLVNYDPINWNDSLYVGTSDNELTNTSIKNFFWVYIDLPNWTAWDPTTAEGEYFLSQYKSAFVNVNTGPAYTRNVTICTYLVPRYNETNKLLTWLLYVVEYEQGTTTPVKAWIATMYSRMSKYGSPTGTYTVRYYAAKKDSVWTGQDVTNTSNIKIEITVPN